MATNVIQAGSPTTVSEHHYSRYQRYILQRFHPRSIFIDTVGFMWFTYYLWNHDWKTAIIIAIIARLMAYISVMNIDIDRFAETLLGKMALLHLNSFNLIIQLIGTVILLFGIWDHSTVLILGGLSIVLLGHLFGWSKVDERLKDRPQSTALERKL